MLHAFALDQDRTWRRRLVPALEASWHPHPALEKSQRSRAPLRNETTSRSRSTRSSRPSPLTPRIPFPRVLNKSLCIALLLRLKRKIPGAAPPTLARRHHRAHAHCPTSSRLPHYAPGQRRFLLLDELIEAHTDSMFRGYEVMSRCCLPRHPQQQSLHGRRGKPLCPGASRLRAAQPPQGRRRSPRDRLRAPMTRSASACA